MGIASYSMHAKTTAFHQYALSMGISHYLLDLSHFRNRVFIQSYGKRKRRNWNLPLKQLKNEQCFASCLGPVKKFSWLFYTVLWILKSAKVVTLYQNHWA